jgi:formylglycine-generating enzyme required for sulfatase activity
LRVESTQRKGSRQAEKKPYEKDDKLKIYPWGSKWPPPRAFANYADSYLRDATKGKNETIPGYVDGFAFTSPVLAFHPNKYGLRDMSGNVWEWCDDLYGSPTEDPEVRVLRGASWFNAAPGPLLLSARTLADPDGRNFASGFRCVLEEQE